MTNSNSEYKKQFAALIMDVYPSFPDDPYELAEKVITDRPLTADDWGTVRSQVEYHVACYGIRKYTEYGALVAKGMAKKEALDVVRKAFFKRYSRWTDPLAMTLAREKTEKAWAKRFAGQGRVGM